MSKNSYNPFIIVKTHIKGQIHGEVIGAIALP